MDALADSGLARDGEIIVERDEYTVEELEDYITRVKECRVNMEINKLSENLKNTIDLEEKKRLATKIENMKKEVLKW